MTKSETAPYIKLAYKDQSKKQSPKRPHTGNWPTKYCQNDKVRTGPILGTGLHSTVKTTKSETAPYWELAYRKESRYQ